MKNKNDNTEDIYDNYYEEPNQDIQTSNIEENMYNSENVSNNHTKEFVDPNGANGRNIKIYRLILGILIVVGILAFGYYIISDYLVPREIKVNLTSFGLVKTKIKSTNYQINYLINPDSKKIPKFQITPSDVIILNEATSNITSAAVGDVTIEVLDINDKKTVRNVFKVYVVAEEIPIEDFTFDDIALKVGAKDMITITPLPYNTTEISFTYRSDDEEIVKVNNEGIVEGLKKGSTTITITNKKIVKTLNIVVK